jgi:predicted acyl esterase
MKVRPGMLMKTYIALASSVFLCLSATLLGAADEVRVVPNVPVSMRDGTILAADVYLPAQAGRYPVLLERSPYGKAGGKGAGVYFAPHGYAVVIQDTRGRYDSEGAWYAFSHE